MEVRTNIKPTQKVDIGVGKDTLNDFARKYNLEIENIYDIVSKYRSRKVVFYSTGNYWTQVTGGYKLSVPHNGNIVFAVYKIENNVEEQVLVGVKRDDENVEFESESRFNGFLLYAVLNGEAGIGYNTEDDIVEMMQAIKEHVDDAAIDAENFAVATGPFTKQLGDDHTTEYMSAQHYAGEAGTSADSASEYADSASTSAETATLAYNAAKEELTKVEGYIAAAKDVGLYDATETYSPGDAVMIPSGEVYRCIATTTGDDPTTSPLYWAVTYTVIGSDAFELDEYGNLVPKVSPSSSQFWSVDGNGDIQPAT